jgi:hypothetical protein
MSILENSDLARTPTYATVYSRTVWGADWIRVDHVRVDSVTVASNPQINGATLSMNFGMIQEYGEITQSHVPAVNLEQKFIKIEISSSNGETPEKVFVFICTEQSDLDEGVRKFGTGPGAQYIRTGKRFYTCLGVEHLLEKQIVLESAVEKPSSGFWVVHRGITFNEPHQRGNADGETVTGNRSTLPLTVRAGRTVHIFPKNLDNAARWSSLDIAEYLLAFYSPVSEDLAQRVEFVLDYSFEFALTWYETPVLPTEGRSVLSLLNQIFDRRRGVSFRTDYDADNDQMVLVLFTFNSSAITYGDDELPANTDQGELDTDSASDIENLLISSETMGKVNQVIVRGERAVTVCTLSYADSTITSYWNSNLDAEYLVAGEDEPGFGTLDQDEQEMCRAAARSQERFAKVYRDYGLPPAWAGKVKDGEAGAENPHFPDLFGDGTASTLNFWLAGMRVEPHLPLRTDSNYTGDAIVDGVENITTEGQPWEYLPIFAAAKTSINLLPSDVQSDVSASDFDYDGRWLNLIEWDKNPALEYAPNLYAITARPLQESPGVSLRVQGAPQYVLSGGGGLQGVLDYYGYAKIDPQYLVITVSMPVDCFCEAKYPASVSGSALVQRVLINARQRARLIYVCPGTVVDVKDGDLVRSTGGYLRDDRARLESLARFAYRWYNTPRKAISFTINRIILNQEIRVGRMITQIGGGGAIGSPMWTSVNTPITMITYEFPETKGPRPAFQRTRLATDFASLNFE